jgi:hypothetical protein
MRQGFGRWCLSLKSAALGIVIESCDENHCHMVALYAVWYNFVRIHKSLRVTPAMESGVADRLFTYEELVRIVDEWEATQKAN